MALALTALTSNATGVDATSFTTAAFTPQSLSLIVAVYQAGRNGTGNQPTTPTVTGGSLTWTAIGSKWWRDSTTTQKVFVFAAYAAASPGSMAITFNHGGNTHISAAWSVYELTGSDAANGVAQSFVQFVTSTGINQTGTDCPLTLAAAGNANNRPFYAVGRSNNVLGVTPIAGWTKIHEVVSSTPSQGLETQWRSGSFNVSANATWSTSSTRGAVAFEVKADTTVPYQPRMGATVEHPTVV